MYIHVVFNDADAVVLQQAIDLDNKLAGEILVIKDDFALGPIAQIFETEGYQQRRDWWKDVLQNSPYTEQLNLVDDKLTITQITRKLTENAEAKVWIWMAQNAHDVCGYYWLIGQLKPFAGQVEVLFLNNLPFINEKGQLFYPTYIHEILPKEVVKAAKLARLVTLSEFEIDPDEFEKMSSQNAIVRFLEGGKKIVAKTDDFFDKQILSLCTKDFQKLAKLVNACLHKVSPKTSDVFVVYRIKQMQATQGLEIKGDWEKGWKEIEVKLKELATEIENG